MSNPILFLAFPSLKEPVLIDSDDYPKYIEGLVNSLFLKIFNYTIKLYYNSRSLDISKHFGGLQVTDFPLYVQGLEFKQHSSNNKVSQSVVLTKPVRQPTGNYIYPLFDYIKMILDP